MLIRRHSFQKSEIAEGGFVELYLIGLCQLFCLQNSRSFSGCYTEVKEWLPWNKNLIRKLWSLGPMKTNALSSFPFAFASTVCHWVNWANKLFQIFHQIFRDLHCYNWLYLLFDKDFQECILKLCKFQFKTKKLNLSTSVLL